MNNDLAAIIALNRFGLGARLGEAEKVTRDPVAFLRAQLKAPPIVPRLTAASRFQQIVGTTAVGKEGLARLLKSGIPLYRSDVVARVNGALNSADSFRERLVYFWSNHFAISTERAVVSAFALPYEEEAIRPHVTGRFADMVLAVARHAGMLLYLDNIRSAGEKSRRAQSANAMAAGPAKPVGLNENFAREVMELHTLGVGAGYTQDDVRSLARILTGWSLNREGPQGGTFLFRPQLHEPGDHTVFGRTFAEGGEEQGVAALRYIATHPATARHIATKLVRHFIHDEPPAKAVAALEKVFLQTGGDLLAVSNALIDLPEAWRESPAKYKSPYDYIISSLRALGVKEVDQTILNAFEVMGQRTFAPPSPQGWPDEEAAWLSGESLRRRLDWTYAIAHRLPIAKGIDARLMAKQVLGPWLSGDTSFAVNGAPSNAEALALVFISPEFQRR